MDAKSDLCERLREALVGRRVEDGISTHDHKHIDLAGVHRRDKRAQRLGGVDQAGLDWVGVGQRLADIAERCVDRVGQRVDSRRLLVAGDHKALAAAVLEILCERGKPAGRQPRLLLPAAGIDAQRLRQSPRERLDLRRLERQPVVRSAGDRRRALDSVEPIHPLLARTHAAAIGELAGIAQVAGAAPSTSASSARMTSASSRW
jgi:hypothetical protein